MFHFVESIQNTRGDALIGFFVKAVDPDTGSVADIYADESATPIVTVSGVANAAEVDSDGNASFYVESGEYHLDIYATDADTFVKRVENVPMITPSDFITDAVLADTGGAALVGTADGGTVQEALDALNTLQITNASSSFSLTDSYSGILWTGSTGTLTIDPSSATEGKTVLIYNIGSGSLTLSRGSGVALYKNGSTSSANATIAVGGHATLIQWVSDVWAVNGSGVS